MKKQEKEIAIRLRLEGKSYNEILDTLKVSKGSLSKWLSNINLTDEQQERIQVKEYHNNNSFGNRISKKWITRRDEVKSLYEPPLHDSQYTLGIGLYWGEGSKSDPHRVALGNTSSNILKVFIAWINKYYVGEFERFSVGIQHHYGVEYDKEVQQWWSDQLNLPLSCFIKCSHVKPRNNVIPRRFGYGIAYVRVCGKGVWKIKQKIDKAIEALMI